MKNTQEAKYIVPDNPEEIKEVKRVFETNKPVRVLKELNGLSFNCTIFDDKIGISSLGDDVFGVIFESKSIVSSMKLVFEALWAHGRKIN